MRGSLTATEELLWNRLRGRRLGGLFRRQVPLLGTLIADFLALSCDRKGGNGAFSPPLPSAVCCVSGHQLVVGKTVSRTASGRMQRASFRLGNVFRPRPRLDQNPKDHHVRDNYGGRKEYVDVPNGSQVKCRNVQLYGPPQAV